ncbi:helix-turn-helix domain-containing protein [Acidocella sp. KAb 2-4]|uniref:helix-turn-helix domain-containing protein n=1 Tax=Acidocella sp. KAb 2-4 TaxID=2885158 RepID=UPI001D06403A|nr:helix-turn-helix domain-containing protein [Acidocella sp. KAb 2-4]MCB5946068.1 helix-turn-helix domain-containing protein [Acidocella sp. KAb 2-4]
MAIEAIGGLMSRKPTAARVLFKLIEYMGDRNAVVVSQKALAKMLEISDRTVKTAIADLTAERWIQSVKLGPGTVNAYVINSRVAWAQKRDELRLSLFHATVVADHADQDLITMDDAPLRTVPVLYPGERQLPTGLGEDPPSQPFIDGLEPDLPARQMPEHQSER